MPQHEVFPIGQEQVTAAQEAVFFDDGSLNEAFLANSFGIGAEEAMQEVTFGGWTGTVAQMLGDKKCPVGDMVSLAYTEKGIEGVTETLKTFSQLDPKFSVRITEKTLQREQVKKN